MLRIFHLYAHARIPEEIWILALMMAVLAVSTGIWRRWQGRDGIRPAAALLLLTYCMVLVCSLVIFRPESTWYKLMWPPLWSYMPAYGGLNKTELIANALNVVLYLPIGFLYKYACKHAHWWTMLTIAAVFSFSIELCQYLIPCGFAEVDDIVHNCLGALIGYGIACAIKAISYQRSEKKTNTTHIR